MRIVRDDGVAGLFRGGGPTVVRAMALNMGMLASNDQAKEMLEGAGFKGQTAVLGGAMIAGAWWASIEVLHCALCWNRAVPAEPAVPVDAAVAVAVAQHLWRMGPLGCVVCDCCTCSLTLACISDAAVHCAVLALHIMGCRFICQRVTAVRRLADNCCCICCFTLLPCRLQASLPARAVCRLTLSRRACRR
jgi:hypothetical protein